MSTVWQRLTPDQRRASAARLRVYKARWREEGRCGSCGAQRDTPGRRLCATCRKARPATEKRREYYRNRAAGLRLQVLAAYGGRCVCCRVKEPTFLALHHPNADGQTHRRENYGSAGMYARLVRDNYPPGYELWCHNCHLSLHQLGECAHTLKGARPRPRPLRPAPAPQRIMAVQPPLTGL